MFQSLKEQTGKFFGEHFEPYFNELVNCFSTIREVLETHHRTLNELEETNANLLSTRTNEIIKVLTIFTVIIAPLTLIASIYGMNLDYAPFRSFWPIMAIMVISLIIMIVFLRKKKWF